MKLKEYIKNLQEIVEEYGDDLDVVWAIDDEESCYKKDYKTNSVLIN